MKHTTTIQIRLSDLDSMGHVNNAVYLHYFETARLHFFRSELGDDWDWQKSGLLLARNEIDYLQPVYVTHEIHVELLCSHIGNKSFTLDYSVVDTKSEEIKSKGRSILVCFDYTLMDSIEIPDEIREVLERYAMD